MYFWKYVTTGCLRPKDWCKQKEDMYHKIDCDGDKIMDQACLKNGQSLDVILSTKNCSGIIGNVSYEMCPNIIYGMIFCKHTCLQCLLAKRILQVLFYKAKVPKSDDYGTIWKCSHTI